MKHLGTRVLESDRLILRKIKENDAKELYDGYVNQEGFIYYANKKKRTLEEEEKSLIGIDKKYENKEYYNWIITLKDNGKIIGGINLVVENINECVEVNYALDERYEKNGYMSEALNRIITFCFEELNVQRFQAGCVVENKASRRVMEKNNMKCEGILRKYIILRDGYHDMYMYSLIKEDFFI